MIGDRLIVLFDLLFLRKEREIDIRTAVCRYGYFQLKRFIRYVVKAGYDITKNSRMFYFSMLQRGGLRLDPYLPDPGSKGSMPISLRGIRLAGAAPQG